MDDDKVVRLEDAVHMGAAKAQADAAERARRAHVDAAHAGAMFAPTGQGLDAMHHLTASKPPTASPSKAGFGGNRSDGRDGSLPRQRYSPMASRRLTWLLALRVRRVCYTAC